MAPDIPEGAMDDAKDRLLSPQETLAVSGGISESTRRRLIAAGDFPRPIVLSRDRHGKAVRVAWVEAEVRQWVAKKIRQDRGVSAA